jgi:hypothetical protein
MAGPLLETKLHVPRQRRGLVARPRLSERLRRGSEAAAIISIGVVSLLVVVTLRQDLVGAPGRDADTLVAIGASLVAVRDWTFLLGPGVMAAVNALLLGSLMYRSGLVPRAIPLMGLIGAPLLLASKVATMFGVNDDTTLWSLVAVAPIFCWELSLGVWLAVKGFKPSPVISGDSPSVAPPER